MFSSEATDINTAPMIYSFLKGDFFLKKTLCFQALQGADVLRNHCLF